MEDGSFDFHFTHTFEDEYKITHEAHHRVCIRNDLLKFLEVNNWLPCLSLEDNIQLIQDKKELSEANSKLDKDKQELKRDLEKANKDLAKADKQNDELMEKFKKLEAILAKV